MTPYSLLGPLAPYTTKHKGKAGMLKLSLKKGL